MPRILVVDDDAETCRFMEELLGGGERVIEIARDPVAAIEKAGSGGFELVISDIHLDAELSGLDVLRAFKQADPAIEVILVSGFGTLETALEAVRAGASDYISKPFDIGQVKAAVERALRRRAQQDSPAPIESFPHAGTADGLIGRSAGMLEVYKGVAQATLGDAPVLITGETGTGKELVARAIHRHSRRAARPFVPVNCGALPEGLLESELFGHVRGAFTGAIADKKGLFEQAHGGTLLLDEIGETTPALQVRLLRVLESGEIRSVGGTAARHVDVRVIAATNRDLERAAAEGQFRQDLYYRLNVIRIRIPALRERVEDIPLLADHFLHLLSQSSSRSVRLSVAAVRALRAHAWPGNVRELENTLERLVLAVPAGTIDVEDLPQPLQRAVPALEERLFTDLPTLDEVEKRYLRHVLAAVNGNRSRAAEVLGIDRRTLYRMAERFGLELDDEGSVPRTSVTPRS